MKSKHFIIYLIFIFMLLLLTSCSITVHLSEGIFVTPYNFDNEFVDSAKLIVNKASSKDENILDYRLNEYFQMHLFLYKDNREFEVELTNFQFHHNDKTCRFDMSYSLTVDDNKYEDIGYLFATKRMNDLKHNASLKNAIEYEIRFQGELREKIEYLCFYDFDTYKINASSYVSDKSKSYDDFSNLYIENNIELNGKYANNCLYNIDYLMSSNYYLVLNHMNSYPYILNVINVKAISPDGNSYLITFTYKNADTEKELKATLIIKKHAGISYLDVRFDEPLNNEFARTYELFDVASNEMYTGIFTTNKINYSNLRILNLEISDSFFVSCEQYDPIKHKSYDIGFTAETNNGSNVEIVITRIDYQLGTEYAKFTGLCYYEFHNRHENVEYQKIYHKFEIRFISEDVVTVLFYDFENESPESKIVNEYMIDLFKNN